MKEKDRLRKEYVEELRKRHEEEASRLETQLAKEQRARREEQAARVEVRCPHCSRDAMQGSSSHLLFTVLEFALAYAFLHSSLTSLYDETAGGARPGTKQEGAEEGARACAYHLRARPCAPRPI